MLDEGSVGDGHEGERAKGPGFGDFGAGVLEDGGVGIAKTLEGRGGVEASGGGGKVVIRSARDGVVVSVLVRDPRACGDDLVLVSGRFSHCPG